MMNNFSSIYYLYFNTLSRNRLFLSNKKNALKANQHQPFISGRTIVCSKVQNIFLFVKYFFTFIRFSTTIVFF